jgi:hypothetical protein
LVQSSVGPRGLQTDEEILRPFVLFSGQSGNPGGGPKVMAEIRDLARDHGAQAIKRHSKNERVAVRAGRRFW